MANRLINNVLTQSDRNKQGLHGKGQQVQV